MPIPMKYLGGHSSGVKEPGEFTYIFSGEADPDQIVFKNPACKYDSCAIRIKQGAPDEKAHRFGWNGDIYKPTITPSIGCVHICGWHGHITNGELLP